MHPILLGLTYRLSYWRTEASLQAQETPFVKEGISAGAAENSFVEATSTSTAFIGDQVLPFIPSSTCQEKKASGSTSNVFGAFKQAPKEFT